MTEIIKSYDSYYKMFSEKQPDGYNVQWASRNSVPFKQEQRTDCVTIIAQHMQYGRIPILKQYRPVIGGDLYELPAGKIDPGETALQTAARELLEETGLELDVESCQEFPLLFPSAGITDESHTIVMGWCRGEPNTDHLTEHEQIEIMMMSERELLALADERDKHFMSLGLMSYIIGIHQNKLLTRSIS